jgi:parallel beta-helix repeat protein/predicted outer membrane repeat protein
LVLSTRFVPCASATTIHVPGNASSIQEGINLAGSGDTVLVASGTYFEHDINMKSGITLLSQEGSADSVTIDAQQQGRVIYCQLVSGSSRIEGLTITGGFVSGSMNNSGAGIACTGLSSPWIVRCTFTNNYASFDGGGIFCDSNSSPHIVECVISENQADNGGAGIRCNQNSSPTLTDCTISNNVGTGLWSTNSCAPTLTRCSITDHPRWGINHNASVPLTLVDCEVARNTGSGWLSGGMRVSAGTADLTGCTFADNSGGAGGLRCDDASATVTKCTFTGNHATDDGGGFFLAGDSQLMVDDTDFSGNTATSAGANGYVSAGSSATLRCSVETLDGFEGDGSITLDNEGCPTPVRAITWGAVKALYR